jgi:hypothetical protein
MGNGTARVVTSFAKRKTDGFKFHILHEIQQQLKLLQL